MTIVRLEFLNQCLCESVTYTAVILNTHTHIAFVRRDIHDVTEFGSTAALLCLIVIVIADIHSFLYFKYYWQRQRFYLEPFRC
jgi:hypothetical protein